MWRKPATAITSRPDKFQTQFGCDSEKKPKHQTLTQSVYCLSYPYFFFFYINMYTFIIFIQWRMYDIWMDGINAAGSILDQLVKI